MTSTYDKGANSIPRDEKSDLEISYSSLDAALARANSLSLVSHLQDALSRVGMVAIFVMALGFGDGSFSGRVAAALGLALVGGLWMVSKHRLAETIRRIEDGYVFHVLQSEPTQDATKWERLSILLGADATARRSAVLAERLLKVEPLLLGMGLAIATLVAGRSPVPI